MRNLDIETLYTLIDNFLKTLEHKEDIRTEMSDAEVIVTYISAFFYHAGNYSKTLALLKQNKTVNKVLSRSRFSRRIHRLEPIIMQIFWLISEFMKQDCDIFQIDSFPVKVCHNIRISKSKIVKGEEYRGKNASKREYFYGFKVHVITSNKGGIVEFNFTVASAHDSVAFDIMEFDLPKESDLFADSAYNNYYMEDILKDSLSINLKPVRKNNSKKKDIGFNWYRQMKRKPIETIFSILTRLFQYKIHATSVNSFIFKLKGFLFTYNFLAFCSFFDILAT